MRDLEQRLTQATDFDALKPVLEDMLMEIRLLQEQLDRINPDCISNEGD